MLVYPNSAPVSRRKTKSAASASRTKAIANETLVEPYNLPAEKGFNIVDHLRSSIDNDGRQGSLSPDIHKLLQDISGVMGSVSPPVEGLSPPTTEALQQAPVSSSNKPPLQPPAPPAINTRG